MENFCFQNFSVFPQFFLHFCISLENIDFEGRAEVSNVEILVETKKCSNFNDAAKLKLTFNAENF